MGQGQSRRWCAIAHHPAEHMAFPMCRQALEQIALHQRFFIMELTAAAAAAAARPQELVLPKQKVIVGLHDLQCELLGPAALPLSRSCIRCLCAAHPTHLLINARLIFQRTKIRNTISND